MSSMMLIFFKIRQNSELLGIDFVSKAEIDISYFLKTTGQAVETKYLRLNFNDYIVLIMLIF